MLFDGFGVCGQHEAGPAAAGVELGAAEEQQRSAAGAVVVAGLVVLSEGAGEGPLGILFAQDSILLGGELRAPLRLTAHDLFGLAHSDLQQHAFHDWMPIADESTGARPQTSAITSISTRTFLGSRETSTVVRAGGVTPVGARYEP